MAGFYEQVLPQAGPFTLLSGVSSDGKLIEVRHYNGIKTHQELEEKVSKLSMQPLNIYYALGSYNKPNRKGPIAKKAFVLDLDSKDFGGSKETSLRELGVFIKATGLPKPSLWVDSGNGYHVFWALDEAIPVDVWLPIAESLKQKCIDLGFKADQGVTADPARVLRCPGTLNRKGLTPLPCRVVLDNEITYSHIDLAKQLDVELLPPATSSILQGVAPADDLYTNQNYENRSEEDVRDMLAYIQLPPAHSMECRELWITVLMTVQDWCQKAQYGFEIFADWSATQPGFKSREDCFKTWDSFEPGGGRTIGTLIKIAREHGWGQSASQGAGEERSFQEQVAATAEAGGIDLFPTDSIQSMSPLLTACKHAVENKLTGGGRFTWEEAVEWLFEEFIMVTELPGLFYSKTEKTMFSKMMIDDLLTRFMPFSGKHVPYTPSIIFKWHGTRNTAACPGFYPGNSFLYVEDKKVYVNLYTEPDDLIVPTQQEADLIADFWDYIFPNASDAPFSDYLMRFYAHAVQRPAVKLASAPIMISEKTGTGKTAVMWAIPRLLVGPRNSRLVSNKVVRSQFSDYVSGAHLLHFDECHVNGRFDSDDTANSLKNLITGETVECHPKGLPQYNLPNKIMVTVTSNYPNAMPLPRMDERRWGIHYLNPTRSMTEAEHRQYFETLFVFLKSPRASGVLRWIFNNVDISGFSPNAPPPMTNAKALMVEKSQSNEVQTIVDAVRENEGPFAKGVWTIQQVKTWLATEVHKTCTTKDVRAFIERALPEARIVKEIHETADSRTAVYAHVNFEKYAAMSNDQLRRVMKN